jgi:DNA-binding GntR family transcriptional regulator
MKSIQLYNIKTPVSSTQGSTSATEHILPVLRTKSQLYKIIVNKNGKPDYLAIDIFWDYFRSWYSPLKEYQSNGNVVQIKKLKSKGVYTSYKKLSEAYATSKETIRQKLVILEKLGLISRNFQHRETVTTKSYNQLVIYVWKETSHFYSEIGLDKKEVKKLNPYTNYQHIADKHNIIFDSQITHNRKTKAEQHPIQENLDTKELRELKSLKDRSMISNSLFDNPNSSTETKTNDSVETKNIVAEEGGNIEATVHTLKPKKHSNSRKNLTTAQTKAKKAKTYRFNQFETPKPKNYFHPLKAEEGSELQVRSGRDFTLNTQNEILLDMATNRPNLQGHRFKSKAQFMAYMSKALYHEKRDAVKTANINFGIKANETEEIAAKRTKTANIEAYLNKVEQRAIVSRDDAIQFRAKLGGTLEPELAYGILSNLSRFSKEGNIFKLIMSKDIEITDFAKGIILDQANAVGAYNGVERLEFIVVRNDAIAIILNL